MMPLEQQQEGDRAQEQPPRGPDDAADDAELDEASAEVAPDVEEEAAAVALQSQDTHVPRNRNCLDVEEEVSENMAADEQGSADSVHRVDVAVLPDFRAQVEVIYKEHNPHKMSNIDQLMQKHAGRETELIQKLHDKYVNMTPSTPRRQSGLLRPPTAAGIQKAVSNARLSGGGALEARAKVGEFTVDYRARVLEIYELHNPEKLSKVDKLLESYSGRENELLDKLIAKYDVADAKKENTTPSSTQADSNRRSSMLRPPTAQGTGRV